MKRIPSDPLGDGGRELGQLSRREWVTLVSNTSSLTTRQAEAFYRRHVDEQDSQQVAAAMECSDSNVNNLERKARSKIIDAQNLVAQVSAVDAVPEDETMLGLCPECNQPTSVLVPTDDGSVCEECADA